MDDAIRVLLVDDEPPVIEGLAAAIERDLSGFTVCGSAGNGRQAIEMARALQPDIILLDVQMPGVDGIEALRTMREHGIQSLAILVTAYERFDVARRGYGLGVRDYLVKPIGPRTIREALTKAETEIRQERQRELHSVELAEDNTRMLRTLERALLHLILAGISDSIAVAEMLTHLGLDGTTVVPVIVRGREGASLGELADRLRYTVHGLVGTLSANTIVALAFHGSESVDTVRDRIGHSLTFASDPSALEVLVGKPAEISDAAAAVEKLSGRTDGVPDARLVQTRAAVLRAVRTGDTDRAIAALHEYTRAAEEQSVLAEAVEALLVLGADAVSGVRGTVADHALEAVLECRRLQDRESRVELARRLIASWAQTLSQIDSLSPVVQAAVSLVRNEFADDISIDELAERLKVSASHLSRTFSAEVGQPLSAYITDVRIQHAFTLLDAGDHSVKEVAALCGYRDPNYFSRAFRAATGQSPSEYAQSRRINADT